MSVLRTAALRLAVNKAPAAVARRYASSALALPEEFQQFTLKDPRIPEGVKALELPVPSSLPKNDFVERRHAVEDHSEGEPRLEPVSMVHTDVQAPPTCGGRSGTLNQSRMLRYARI